LIFGIVWLRVLAVIGIGPESAWYWLSLLPAWLIFDFLEFLIFGPEETEEERDERERERREN
jgi:hypothetical protein